MRERGGARGQLRKDRRQGSGAFPLLPLFIGSSGQGVSPLALRLTLLSFTCSAPLQALFSNAGVFLEKYIRRARHIEVQVFGDGEGRVMEFGEREVSSSPLPLLLTRSPLVLTLGFLCAFSFVVQCPETAPEGTRGGWQPVHRPSPEYVHCNTRMYAHSLQAKPELTTSFVRPFQSWVKRCERRLSSYAS